MAIASLGHVSKAPHPVLFELLYEPALAHDREHVLPHLLRIDAAHVVMLMRQGLVAPETAARLLAVNRDLARRRDAGEALFAEPAPHRGLYLRYEHEYIERLGPDAGGSAHLARSRNDILATVTRLRAREALLDLLESYVAFLRTTLEVAETHVETVFPGFTHGEPAQPTTFGHYLTGAASEVSRSLESLAGWYPLVNRCPMGAAAGFGTSLPIDREQVAALLGFAGLVENSADAIASRDYVVHTLASLASIGVTLTRVARDLQDWGGSAYRFLDWDDDLVSTSSIMPQKRNLFAFENLRGAAVQSAGALVNSIMAMKSTPFANGIEVNHDAVAPLWGAVEASRRAVSLARVLIEHARVRRDAVAAFLARTPIASTELANLLATDHRLPFRTAHEAAAEVSRLWHDDQAPEVSAVKRALEAAIARRAGRVLTIDRRRLEQALDPAAAAAHAQYGGGPSPVAVGPQIAALRARASAVDAQVAAARERTAVSEHALVGAIAAVTGPVPSTPK